jgi:ribosomal protein S18 acetylase RimI-like enzyme
MMAGCRRTGRLKRQTDHAASGFGRRRRLDLVPVRPQNASPDAHPGRAPWYDRGVQVAPRKLENLLLRCATREDAHACAEILREGADDGLVARADEVSAAALMRQIESARAASNSLCIVATRAPAAKGPRHDDLDDDVIGLLLLEGAPLLRLHDVARLTMAVRPGQRGQGVGRQLMEYAMEVADNSGLIRKIELLTRAFNERSIRLYTGLGFVEEGRLRARLRLEDGTYCDDVCMARFRPEPKPAG